MGGYQQLALLNDLQRGLVLAVKAHHEGGAQLYARLLRSPQHAFGFRHAHAQWLLAQHVHAGPGASQHLLVVQVRRRSHVHGLDVRRQQFRDARHRRGAEFAAHFLIDRGVDVVHRHQLRIGRRNDAFGNGPAQRDAARPNDAPPNLADHTL